MHPIATNIIAIGTSSTFVSEAIARIRPATQNKMAAICMTLLRLPGRLVGDVSQMRENAFDSLGVVSEEAPKLRCNLLGAVSTVVDDEADQDVFLEGAPDRILLPRHDTKTPVSVTEEPEQGHDDIAHQYDNQQQDATSKLQTEDVKVLLKG